jgi:hypothetical protein
MTPLNPPNVALAMVGFTSLTECIDSRVASLTLRLDLLTSLRLRGTSRFQLRHSRTPPTRI